MPRRRTLTKKPRKQIPLGQQACTLDAVSDLCAIYGGLYHLLQTARSRRPHAEGHAEAFRIAAASIDALLTQLEPHARARVAVLKRRGVARLLERMLVDFYGEVREYDGLRTFVPRAKIPRALLKP